MAPTVLADATATAIIGAPIEAVDLADWLFTLGDAEYQRCAPGEHIAAGATTTDDGRPMSINVEQVGGALAIQHYVGEVVTPAHCRLVSLSDSFTPAGRTTLHVTWELTLTTTGTNECLLTNRVVIQPTDDYLSFLDEHGVPVDQAADASQAAINQHNNVETPLFAKSIERKVLAAAGEGATHHNTAIAAAENDSTPTVTNSGNGTGLPVRR